MPYTEVGVTPKEHLTMIQILEAQEQRLMKFSKKHQKALSFIKSNLRSTRKLLDFYREKEEKK